MAVPSVMALPCSAAQLGSHAVTSVRIRVSCPAGQCLASLWCVSCALHCHRPTMPSKKPPCRTQHYCLQHFMPCGRVQRPCLGLCQSRNFGQAGKPCHLQLHGMSSTSCYCILLSRQHLRCDKARSTLTPHQSTCL